MANAYEKGDPVVYVMTKQSEHPGPRATNVQPAPHGDTYRYQVDKYWRVKDVLPDGEILIVTRRGKERLVRTDDPSLRKPNWLERVFRSDRFPPKSPKTGDSSGLRDTAPPRSPAAYLPSCSDRERRCSREARAPRWPPPPRRGCRRACRAGS